MNEYVNFGNGGSSGGGGGGGGGGGIIGKGGKWLLFLRLHTTWYGFQELKNTYHKYKK